MLTILGEKLTVDEVDDMIRWTDASCVKQHLNFYFEEIKVLQA